MKQLFPRGKRIRPTDKDLVFHTALAALFPVFLLVILLFHIRQIAGTNWQEVPLSQIVQDVNIPYLLFSMGVAGMVCLTAVLLFWRYRRDEVKQLIHRQKLARMVLENKWYESEQRKEDAFFKDLSSSRSKETITYFPKIYYRMKQGLLHIRVEITLGKYQEQLLNLERKLESGLYCELTDKELKDSYVEYTLLYDTIANRISIEDVQAKDGRLRLMENVWWEYDKLPPYAHCRRNRRRKDLFHPDPHGSPAPHQRHPVRVRPKERRPCGFTGSYAGCVLQKGRYARLH